MEHTATRRQKRELRQLNEDITSVLATPEGRRVMVWTLALTGVYTPSFAATAERTAYNEGQRAVGLAVINQLQAVDPMAYANLLRDSVTYEQSKRVQEEKQDDFD